MIASQLVNEWMVPYGCGFQGGDCADVRARRCEGVTVVRQKDKRKVDGGWLVRHEVGSPRKRRHRKGLRLIGWAVLEWSRKFEAQNGIG